MRGRRALTGWGGATPHPPMLAHGPLPLPQGERGIVAGLAMQRLPPYLLSPMLTLDLSRAPSTAPALQPANLAGLTRVELQRALVEADAAPPEKAKMRAGQLWRWIHHYGATDFDSMTDISKEMRDEAGRPVRRGAAGGRRAPGVEGRHPQVADPHGARASRSRPSTSPTSAGPARCACPARSAAR